MKIKKWLENDTFNNDAFEFETDDISYMNVEKIICSHCGLHYPCSSNFTKLQEGINKIEILTEDGAVSCYVRANKSTDNKGWIVYVDNIEGSKS